MKKAFFSGLLAVALVSPLFVSAQAPVTVSGLNMTSSQAQTPGTINTSTFNLPQNPNNSIAPASACASLTTTGLPGVVNCIISLMNDVTVLIVAASVVYIMYGAFEMIRSEEKREAGKEIVIYGIIGLFVMISIWGFVNILDKTFNLSNTGPLSAPALVKPTGQ